MSYTPWCLTESRVYINGETRIPVGDVDLHIRKEGPIDMGRYLEAEFASPKDGEDFVSAFTSLSSDDRNDFDTVRVDILDEATQTYFLAFHGLVTGVGNAPQGPEQWWTFRAQSPELLLKRIPASKSFSDASALDVLQYVRDELNDRLPFNVSLQKPDDVAEIDVRDAIIIPEELTYRDLVSDVTGALNAAQTLSKGEVPDVDISAVDVAESIFAPALAGVGELVRRTTGVLATPKTFQSNKDTLADVLNWLRDKAGLRIWLTPTADGVSFVATDKPTSGHHDAHYLGGGLRVVDNDALTELTPVNTMVVKGQAKESIVSHGDFELNTPVDDYVTVKARHTPLYERAGGRELHAANDILSDAESKQEVINEAKSLLKQEIDGPTNGDMKTLVRGPITPYDTVRAKPTCGDSVSDVDPTTYEVQRVHHKIRASGMSTTKLNVGVHAALSDIEIVDSWQTDT